jgi:hypothetical protein
MSEEVVGMLTAEAVMDKNASTASEVHDFTIMDKRVCGLYVPPSGTREGYI